MGDIAMNTSRRSVLQGMAATAVMSVLSACTSDSSSSSPSGSATTGSGSGAPSGSLAWDAKGWSFDATNDVYYQIGRSYAATPQAPDYQTLGIFVPAKYLTATKNPDGVTYTATVNPSGSVGGFTAATAPIVLPVDTPGYAAQKPPTSYSYNAVSAYLKAGFVYVWAGMRGKDSNSTSYTGNAPWGVTDLKAAVRFLRYNASQIPGSKDRMFVFGMSGGGAQTTIMGASGDSALYTPYLQAIGAATTGPAGETLSDAVAGAMAWCPITTMDSADAAYEWNMGQFSASGTRAAGTWTAAYSTDLAKEFPSYLNALGLKDASGKKLALESSATGIALSGSYYDHLVGVIEESLNNFVADTTFPYTPSSGGMGGPGGGMPGGGMPGGGAPPSGTTGPAQGGSTTSSTYATIEDYISSLNVSGPWVTYDAATKKAKVASLQGFVTSQKSPSKSVGAFDGPSRGVGENVVFGLGTTALHFDATAEKVIAANAARYAGLTGWQSAYAATEYTSDLAKKDAVGVDVPTRVNMYNPMYYLCDQYAGYQKSKVAPYWRIRTGIKQGDTANTVEVNLALALASYGVKAVDFATVWGQAHVKAERTGDATTNFVNWVIKTLA